MIYKNKSFIIKNAKIVTPITVNTVTNNIRVEDGKIKTISEKPIQPNTNEIVIDAKENILGPGLIDMHIHGCGGFDTASVTDTTLQERALHMEQNISNIHELLCKNGITSFQLAIVPHLQTLENIYEATKLQESNSWKKSFIGVYAEGPFINEQKKGGISLDSIKTYSKKAIETLLKFENSNKKLISCMTIAPETLQTNELYQILAENNIKAAWGHSMALANDVPKLKNVHITHLFNAMTPLGHRKQGLAGVPFLKDFKDATFELICDTIHVCPEMLELVFSTIRTTNLCLISDGMSQAGMPKGDFEYMGKAAVNDGIGCRYKDDGLLIGSALLINKTGQMLFEKGLITISDFFKIASSNPARALGLQDRGSIEIGKRADMILADKKLNIMDVFCS